MQYKKSWLQKMMPIKSRENFLAETDGIGGTAKWVLRYWYSKEMNIQKLDGDIKPY